jgi:hypothetical protein
VTGMSHHECLVLSEAVTEKGLAKLQKALPKMEINKPE